MFILDSLLVNGLRFVLDKVALAVEAEQDDEGAVRESLLDAQMQLDAGTISKRRYLAIERDAMARLNEIRRRRQGDTPDPTGAYRITGADVQIRDDTDA